MPMSQAQEVRDQLPRNPFDEKEDELSGTKDAVGFQPDNHGVYHWIYAMDMKKDKSILYLLIKIHGIIMAIMYFILVILIARGHGSIQDTFSLLKIFVPVFLAIVVICYFSYWLTSLGMGGTYYMQYDMEEEGVRFSNTGKPAPKTVAKRPLSLSFHTGTSMLTCPKSVRSAELLPPKSIPTLASSL